MAVWLAFLAWCGLKYQRTHGSHAIYDRPGRPLPRPVPVRPSKDNQVPLLHMQTTLRTLGLQMQDFTDWHTQAVGKGGKLKEVPRPAQPD